MKRSYLDYAMSVIVSRAIPDLRDGLKPEEYASLAEELTGGDGFDDIVLLEQTFFDQDMQPLKRMTGHDIKDLGDNRIVAMRMRMHSLEEKDHWTELVYDRLEFNVELKDRLFTQFSLKNP